MNVIVILQTFSQGVCGMFRFALRVGAPGASKTSRRFVEVGNGHDSILKEERSSLTAAFSSLQVLLGQRLRASGSLLTLLLGFGCPKGRGRRGVGFRGCPFVLHDDHTDARRNQQQRTERGGETLVSLELALATFECSARQFDRYL